MVVGDSGDSSEVASKNQVSDSGLSTNNVNYEKMKNKNSLYISLLFPNLRRGIIMLELLPFGMTFP